MYKTGGYILGIAISSIFALLSMSNISDEVTDNKTLTLIDFEQKEKISIDKEIQVDSLKNKAKYEIALLNEELNIK